MICLITRSANLDSAVRKMTQYKKNKQLALVRGWRERNSGSAIEIVLIVFPSFFPTFFFFFYAVCSFFVYSFFCRTVRDVQVYIFFVCIASANTQTSYSSLGRFAPRFFFAGEEGGGGLSAAEEESGARKIRPGRGCRSKGICCSSPPILAMSSARMGTESAAAAARKVPAFPPLVSSRFAFCGSAALVRQSWLARCCDNFLLDTTLPHTGQPPSPAGGGPAAITTASHVGHKRATVREKRKPKAENKSKE